MKERLAPGHTPFSHVSKPTASSPAWLTAAGLCCASGSVGLRARHTPVDWQGFCQLLRQGWPSAQQSHVCPFSLMVVSTVEHSPIPSSLSVGPITRIQLSSENIKWKIPKINSESTLTLLLCQYILYCLISLVIAVNLLL